MASKEDEIGLWTVAKIVLLTAGAIYLVSLVTWFAHWAVMLAAIGGAGYLAWTVSSALGSDKVLAPSQLETETVFDTRMRQLEAEEQTLDHKIGL